ncbi:beta-ketoacyl synthase chain length factor [soil metagenome]
MSFARPLEGARTADPAANAATVDGSMTVYLSGIGLLGPGLTDWNAAREILAGRAPWVNAPTLVTASTRLPPAERRRAGDIVKLSMAVADQACADAHIDPQTLATVFSASTGDAKNCHSLCEALALPDRLVSPTRFTNSVHNASAGYWHIACKSQAPSTSLCAYDGSFCAGLLEAATQCLVEQRPVMLVTADVPYPEPLHGVRPISETIGSALVISHEPGAHDIARLQLRLCADAPDTCDGPLEKLRLAAPTARSLPLLQALAGRDERTAVLEYLDGLSLQIEVTPCRSKDES